MTAVAYSHVSIEPDTLLVVDAARRSYLGLSRDGKYLHHVRPARKDDPTVGDGLVREGDLTCDCAAGRFGHHECYWTKRAMELEAGLAAGFQGHDAAIEAVFA